MLQIIFVTLVLRFTWEACVRLDDVVVFFSDLSSAG
jgi:hypothetical protein